MKKDEKVISTFLKGKLKLLLVLKLTFLLSVVFMQVSATVYSQNALLDIKLKNGTIAGLMKYVEDNSEFVFIYKAEDLNMQKKLSLELEDEFLMLL